VVNPTSSASPSLWRRRVIDPIKTQLTQGITADKIALTIAIGVACGIFPFLGFTTLLCFVVAWVLRLNQPIIHLVNQLLWPVHLPLIPLFVRAGELIYGAQPMGFKPHMLHQLVEDLRHDPIDFIDRFGRIGLYALTAWAISAPILIAVLYVLLRPFLRTVTAVVKQPPSVKTSET